jgi:hypothetical protein
LGELGGELTEESQEALRERAPSAVLTAAALLGSTRRPSGRGSTATASAGSGFGGDGGVEGAATGAASVACDAGSACGSSAMRLAAC